jgi:hypothetical protein
METEDQNRLEIIRESLRPVIAKYIEKGWSNFQVGRPGSSTYSGPRIFIHVTSPIHRRIHHGFDDGEDLVQRVDEFLATIS